MFEKLKQKWKVGGWQFLLIFITFALGGSATGYLGKRLMEFTGIKQAGIYIPVYIILVTILWPACVLIISIPMGQFRFFLNYLRKIFGHFRRKKRTDVKTQCEDVKM